MPFSIVGAIILLGIALMLSAQGVIVFHAFTANPLKGLLCFIIPLYVFVYAQKSDVPVWFMRVWYLGIAVFILGGLLASR